MTNPSDAPPGASEGYWAPDPYDGANYLRWVEGAGPTNWIARREYPSLTPVSEPMDAAAHTANEQALTGELVRSNDKEIEGNLKEQTKALAKAASAHGQACSKAQGAFVAAQQEYDSAYRAAETIRAAASEGRKLRALGVVRRVVLYEDRIQVQGATYPLTPDVRASAEQHGNKQVVQGWVFKSNQDRREVYLTIEGPSWNAVVPFNIKNSFSNPKELHQLAATINTAAKNSEALKREIKNRVATAHRQALQAWGNRRSVDDASESLVSQANEVEGLDAEIEALERLVAEANPEDRATKRAVQQLETARKSISSWRENAQATAAQVAEASQAVASELPKLIASAEKTAAAELPAANEERDPERELKTVARNASHENRAEPPSGDVLEQIRRLGELREAGLLTDDEFDSKKRELLERL